MYTTLEDFANYIADNPEDKSVYPPMCDWMTEQGFHNFDVGKEIYLTLLQLQGDLNGPDLRCEFILSDYYSNDKYNLWESNIKAKLVKDLPIVIGKFISHGIDEVCFKLYNRTEFWHKCFVFNDVKKAIEFNNFIIKRICK